MTPWQPWIEFRAGLIKQYRTAAEDPVLSALSAGMLPMIRSVEKLITLHGGPALRFDPDSTPLQRHKR